MNLRREAAGLNELWSPRVVAQVNDQYVKVAKVRGELTWHRHEHEDELFLVLDGRLTIDYEDHSVELGAGDVHVVPRNTLHFPHCEQECLLALVESVTTRHTGDVVSEQTRSLAEQLSGFEPAGGNA